MLSAWLGRYKYQFLILVWLEQGLNLWGQNPPISLTGRRTLYSFGHPFWSFCQCYVSRRCAHGSPLVGVWIHCCQTECTLHQFAFFVLSCDTLMCGSKLKPVIWQTVAMIHLPALVQTYKHRISVQQPHFVIHFIIIQMVSRCRYCGNYFKWIGVICVRFVWSKLYGKTWRYLKYQCVYLNNDNYSIH